jgi:hypothetical protein
MLRKTFVALLVGLFVAGSVFAQDEINVGETVEGDARNETVSYELAVEEGVTYSIRLESDDFDTYLELFDDRDNSLAFNDDAGSTSVSLITYTATDSDTIRIDVRAFGGDADGDFTLTVEAIEIETLSYGDTIEVDGRDQSVLDFNLEAQEGDMLDILFVSSDDGDATLEVFNGDTSVAYDGDGGEDFNPYIRSFVVPEDGIYTIRLTPFGDEIGEGELTVQEVEPTVLAAGSSLEVEFDEDVTSAVFFVEATDGEEYTLTIDNPDGNYLSVQIFSEGSTSFFAASSITLSGVQSVQTRFESDVDGLLRITADGSFFSDDTTITFSLSE